MIYTGRLSLNPWKLDKAATVALFTLERSAKAIRDPYIHNHSGVMSFSWPGIPSPLRLPTEGRLRPMILSAHFLSVRKPYYAFSLPLMETHANLLQPPTSQHFMKLSMSCSKVLKMSKKYILGGQTSPVQRRIGKMKWLKPKCNFDLPLNRLFLQFCILLDLLILPSTYIVISLDWPWPRVNWNMNELTNEWIKHEW